MPGAIAARVTAVVARQTRTDPAALAPDTRLEALGLDSMALVELIFALEEEFDISIPFNANRPDEASADMATVAGITSQVEALMAERAD